MFTSAERSADAEASSSALPDGVRAIGAGIGTEVTTEGAVPSVAFSGGRGTAFLGIGGDSLGRTSVSAIVDVSTIVSTTASVDDALLVTTTGASGTLTSLDMATKKTPTRNTATTPMYGLRRDMCIR